jgi:hypothetical protein
MTPRQAYAARAETARFLRTRGYSIRAIAAIFKTTPEPARQLVARGERLHREQIRLLFP